MTVPTIVQSCEGIAPYLEGADHVDVKSIEGPIEMRPFIANMFSYMPGWMRFLYRVRWLFVRLLGMSQEGIPQAVEVDPAAISFTPGDSMAFFEVKAAEEDRFYVAGATESHLTAYLGVIQEPLSDSVNRYYMVTIVKYHRWTGPVYFNVIRPFHHIVVNRMMKAGMGDSNKAVLSMA